MTGSRLSIYGMSRGDFEMWDRNRRNMLGTMDDMPQYRKYMTQALELAHKGAGWVNPNPLVGTVVVRDGEILAAGYHDRYRGPHAERMAFDYADEHGIDMHGATVIDTLEPCCHVGSQPACTDLILSHGITRVVVGSIDPNPIVAGNAFVYGGDDRYASNIFLDGAGTLGSTGLSAYRGYPSTMAEYLQSVHDIFASGVTNGHDPQPVQMLYSWDNAYVGEAEGPEGEQGTTHVASPVNVRCEFKGDDLYLLFDCPTELADKKAAVVGTADLGVPRIVDERYEETDGSDIVIDTDIVGRRRAELSSVGPFAELHPGSNRQLAWCGAVRTTDDACPSYGVKEW